MSLRVAFDFQTMTMNSSCARQMCRTCPSCTPHACTDNTFYRSLRLRAAMRTTFGQEFAAAQIIVIDHSVTDEGSEIGRQFNTITVRDPRPA